MHEEASVDLEVASGAGAGETELAVTVYGEPGVVSVGTSGRGGDGVGDVGFGDASRLLQMTLQDVTFDFKLAGVGDVLPLATSAFSEVRTRGPDAVGGGVDDLSYRDCFGSPPTFNYLDLNGLAGDGEGYWDGLTVEGGEDLAVGGEGVVGEGHG